LAKTVAENSNIARNMDLFPKNVAIDFILFC
jgi:hypothetical protein